MSEAKKWTSQAGPIQTKKVSKALQSIQWEGNTYTELTGIVGGEEHRYSYTAICGACREDCRHALTGIAEKFNYTVTRENYQQIIAECATRLEALQSARPVTDKRKTAEADAQQKAEWQQAEAERQAKEREKREQVRAKVIELQPIYSWAVAHREGLSTHARVGQNIREILARTFPGVGFSVRTDYNSARVEWEMGPRTREVDACLSIFKDGHFDGMTDSHEHDHSVRGEAMEILVGRVTYVSTSRNFSPETYRQVGQLLCELQKVEYKGEETTGLMGDDDHERLGSHVHQLLHATSFPLGAKIVGIEREGQERDEFHALMFAKYGAGWADQDKRAALEAEDLAKLEAFEAEDEKEHKEPEHRHWCKLKLEVPAVLPQAATPAARSDSGITVRRNTAKNGVEIKFPGKPSPEVLSRVKAARWRWYGPTQVWYTRFSAEAWRFAHEIAGLPAPALAQESGPDPVDMAYEDACAAACGA